MKKSFIIRLYIFFLIGIGFLKYLLRLISRCIDPRQRVSIIQKTIKFYHFDDPKCTKEVLNLRSCRKHTSKTKAFTIWTTPWVIRLYCTLCGQLRYHTESCCEEFQNSVLFILWMLGRAMEICFMENKKNKDKT